VLHERELELRQQRYSQIRALSRVDPAYLSARSEIRTQRAAGLPDLRNAVASFMAGRDVEALRDEVAAVLGSSGAGRVWPGVHLGVVQFLDDLTEHSPDVDELAGLLATSMQVPQGDGVAELEALVRHVELVQQGSTPSTRHAVSFLSFWWWVQAPEDWYFVWPAVEDAMRRLGWLRGDEPPERLLSIYQQTCRTLGDGDTVEDTLTWQATGEWHGLDRSLPARLEWAAQINDTRDQGSYPDGLLEVIRTDIAAALAEVRWFGDVMLDTVSAAVGRTLKRQVVNEYWAPGAVRANVWVKWKPVSDDAAGWNMVPSIWLVVVKSGILIGFHPGRREVGWTTTIRERLESEVPDSLELIGIRDMWTGGDPDLASSGEFTIGRWFPGDELFGNEDLRDQVERIAAACQPVFDLTMQIASGATAAPPAAVTGDDPLLPEVDRFRAATGYRSERDERHQQSRVTMAESLQRDVLEELDLNELGRICNSPRYGSTGFTNPLRAALSSAGPAEADRIRALVEHLLWGDSPVEQRLDRCLDNDDLGVPGIGEPPLLKLLAIAHPERFLPLFRLRGQRGKAKLLASLGLDEPDRQLSRGTRHVLANDTLHERLEPLFPGDPWGQAAFATWYAGAGAVGVDGLEERLDEVVQDCLLRGRKFIDGVLDLLREKRQIVFYGPPGTGKTYIAKKLAEAIAPDPELRRLVQFHPSTSYEDFFEGYRPATDASGNLSYTLQQGPFAQLADHAAEDPSTHVLLIDELNRANIPKVFGELLFLLEYRGDSVVPLYRPDGFQLPENLWVIATMNTADRSIATIDAALRRRFHFVGIFPDQDPVAGLLHRFFDASGGDSQWADLVDMVNEELRSHMGNGDLLIGPSHFLKPGLDADAMARVWRYDIEPFLEDQFFGDQSTIDNYRWPKVLARHQKRQGLDQPGELSADVDGGDELDATGGEPA
jgi:5-methylcytosine-specific restriction protein B